jgi:hypothetical protein
MRDAAADGPGRQAEDQRQLLDQFLRSHLGGQKNGELTTRGNLTRKTSYLIEGNVKISAS